MVSYAELANMDMTRLAGAAEVSGVLAGRLATHTTDLRTVADIPPDVWSGPDEAAASDSLVTRSESLYAVSDVFARCRTILEELVTALGTARERLGDAHERIAGTGITIGPDGTVTTPVVQDADVATFNEELAQQARAVIDEALRWAREADDRAANALALFGFGFGFGDESSLFGDDGKPPLWLEILTERLSPGFFDLLPPEMQSKIIGTLTKETAEAQGADCREIDGLMVCVNAPSWMYERGGTTIGDTFVSAADSFEELEARPAPFTLSELINHEKFHRDEQWRRYGIGFIPMYLAEEAVAPGGENRYERAAEAAGRTGY
ncbi:hypothetical protein LX16_1891 [Stackebrandtia albiflava]|uniref:Uncharacterized protein n=1 Tax=Stackebrandtia albiflava TaxID=406432 RepID=A0A562VEC2_9ACTN|nr:hypothetical protein [Stackebrandtia albiflava]TWJ16167.1 hypothetical protein LX16_1891 [Stackebrandtia albiflava]